KRLGAWGRLLDEVASLDGHADLVPEGEKQAVFRGSKAAAVRSAKEEHAKGVLLRLKADGHNAAKTLRESELPKATNGLFAFESGDSVVIAKIAKAKQAAKA